MNDLNKQQRITFMVIREKIMTQEKVLRQSSQPVEVKNIYLERMTDGNGELKEK